MSQKAIFIILLGIIYISGCIGSSVADKIPTENLPDSLKLVNKNDNGFVYRSDDGSTGVQVEIFELTSSANTDFLDADKKRMLSSSEDFNRNNRNNLTNIVSEETVVIDGLSVRHLQSKVGGTKDSKYYAFNMADIYLIQNDNSAIKVGAVEDLTYGTSTPKDYQGTGLKITKMIIQNLKK